MDDLRLEVVWPDDDDDDAAPASWQVSWSQQAPKHQKKKAAPVEAAPAPPSKQPAPAKTKPGARPQQEDMAPSKLKKKEKRQRDAPAEHEDAEEPPQPVKQTKQKQLHVPPQANVENVPKKKTKKARPAEENEAPDASPKASSSSRPLPTLTQQEPGPKKQQQKATKQEASTSKQDKKQPKLLSKMKEQLMGGRFRWLNEKLYTCEGSEAFSLFQENPDLFDEYHQGFQAQAKEWPINPQDVFIDDLNSKPSSLVVADFGCGEANIAAAVKQKVHSFDLVARNERITACDMANVPLKSGTVDIAIFSLSLMGVNAADFIREAHRVLKPKGQLKIAEVVSRIESISQFIKEVSALGFKLMSTDESSKFFVFLEFIKSEKKAPAPGATLTLKPCLYKKR